MTEIYYIKRRRKTWIDIVNIDFRYDFQIKADVKFVAYLI